MAADGQVVLEVSADNKKLQQTLKETTSAIEKESKNWDNAVDQSAKNMQSAMAKALDINRVKDWALKAGKAILDFSVDCVNAASDLAEVQNVVDVTFGESSAEIDRWAKDAINQFGLTETRAKKFASTMGAMMKSSGVASKDITEMSETLAGLAADMSSFYNLDFEEAFNKIRSGIAGETEPLKQLGINMSVANLEAFALSQGLKKTFNEMSQGEQIMLRYQYLMQATSDAQGDFARTSDGFANGLRLLQSNFESLKTTIGTLFIPMVSNAIGFLNDMLGLLIPETKQTTVLDDFASIDLQMEQKLDDIGKTRAEAESLLGVLQEIESAKVTDNSEVIGKMSGAANELSASAGSNWTSFINGLNGVDDVIEASDGGTQAGTDLKELAEGAKKVTGFTFSAFKYKNLPGDLKELYTETDKADTAKGNIKKIDDEAGKLTKGNETGFKFGALVTNLDGLHDTTKETAEKMPDELSKLDSATADITKDTKTGFKFSTLESDLDGLKKKPEETATELTKGLEKVDSATTDITTEKTTDFKFTDLESDLDSLKTKPGETAEGVKTGVSKLDAETADITTDQTTGFKFGALQRDLSGLESTVDTAAQNLPSDVSTIDTETSKLTGTEEKWRFGAVKTGVEDLVSAGNEFVTENTKTELGDVKDAADGLSGQKENFKYANLTSKTDGVGALISEADGGAKAGTDLENLGTGAEKVASINYGVNGSVKNLADDIKTLKSTSLFNWMSILNVFNNLPGYAEKLNPTAIAEIATAFAGLNGDKAAAWQTLMDALGSDLTALSTLTGEDEQGAAAWLTSMKEAANGLNNNDVDAWDRLLTKLAAGTPGAENLLTFEDMYKVAEAMGIAETTYIEYQGQIMSMADANDIYLKSLEQLVQTYPELNDMINTETGEIEGGTAALQERITAIAEQREAEVLLYGIQQKRAALEKKFAELPSLRADAAIAQSKVNQMQASYDRALERMKELGAYLTEYGNWELTIFDPEKQQDMIELIEEVIDPYEELVEAAERAKEAYEEQATAFNDASHEYDKLEEETKNLTQAQEDGAGAAHTYNKEQQDAAREGVKALTDALKDMNDYIDRTRKTTEDSIDSSLKGFKSFEKGYDYIHNLKTKVQAEETDWLKKEQENYDKAQKNNEQYVKKTFTGWNDVPNLDKMEKALQSQTAFLTEYNDNLIKLQEWGLTDEFLSQFADMSQENAGYLYLMVEGGKDAALKLQDEFKKMSDAKKPLVDSLTELKLNADDEFQELVKKVQEAAENLDQSEIAKDSMAKTIEGIAAGISEHVDDVKTAVDALNAELERLGEVQNLNIFDGLNGGGFSFHFTGSNPDSNAKGLDYVPYDNYLSYLHEGEAVLTAEEARVWRNFVNGGANIANTIDYAQLSGAIWDNAPHMGGNVYLDGATVGRVISAQQANSMRTLERSGWQG